MNRLPVFLALRGILLCIAPILLAVTLPPAQAWRSPAAGPQAEPAARPPAPMAGSTSPAIEFRQQTRAIANLPGDSYGLAVNAAEAAFELQPLMATSQQALSPRQIGSGRDVGLLSAVLLRAYTT